MFNLPVFGGVWIAVLRAALDHVGDARSEPSRRIARQNDVAIVPDGHNITSVAPFSTVGGVRSVLLLKLLLQDLAGVALGVDPGKYGEVA